VSECVSAWENTSECVCVRERERERDLQHDLDLCPAIQVMALQAPVRDLWNVCVCVCVCVIVCEYVRESCTAAGAENSSS